MKYSIKKLADKYASHLFINQKTIKKPKITRIDLSAYNDYEYLNALQDIDKDYLYCDSLATTETFLKGVNVDNEDLKLNLGGNIASLSLRFDRLTKDNFNFTTEQENK